MPARQETTQKILRGYYGLTKCINLTPMETPDYFFIPENEMKLPDELDYSRAVVYIRPAEAFSRSIY